MFPVCSVEDAHPGTRASRPHHVRHSLGHLRHLVRPVTARWACSGLARAVHSERPAACLQPPADAPRPPARNRVAGGTPALPGGPFGRPVQIRMLQEAPLIEEASQPIASGSQIENPQSAIHNQKSFSWPRGPNAPSRQPDESLPVLPKRLPCPIIPSSPLE